ELLTGRPPFDPSELLQSGLDEMRRTIREREPDRPSTRLSTMAEGELTTVAKHRHTEAPRLIHLVRGDLDWIVMKCLEKDRTRRYETANGLASDIQRHLNNEPVVARPPSGLYRIEKLVRRHRLAFTAAALVALALVLGIVASTWQAIRATHFRRLAAAGDDGLVRLWDFNTRAELPSFETFAASLDPTPLDINHAVAFSPDGRRLAAGGPNREIRIWDLATREQLATLTGHTNRI